MTPASRHRQTSSSALLVVTLSYAVLLVLPSELALVGPLQSNGAPVRLLGLLAFFLVLAAALQWRHERDIRPVAAVLIAYLALEMAVWSASNRGGEIVGGGAFSDRALLRAVAAVGIAVLCALVVHTVDQAHRLVGLLVFGGVVSAVAGMLQSLGVIRTWADVVALPFTTLVVSAGGVTSRGELARVSGSAGHPIEFAVVIGMLVPLALHLITHARTRRGRRLATAATAILLVGFPLGVSRSGLVALVVGLLIYGWFLTPRGRGLLLAGVAIASATAVVIAPTVVDTFAASIIGADQDNSVTGRIDDYPAAFARVATAPWLGGAPADPTVRQTVLDNQWLGTLVQSGVLGVASLALLFVGVVYMARRAILRADGVTEASRSLNGALAAGVSAAAVCAGTFDLLSFQQAVFLVFMLAGLVGVRDDRAAPLPSPGLSCSS